MESSKLIGWDRLRHQLTHFSPIPTNDSEILRIEEGRLKAQEKKQMIQDLFDSIDTDDDKFITKSELKKYIKDQSPNLITPGISKRILKMEDGDKNDRLDFNEFNKLTNREELNWLFSYARLVEPPRRKNPDNDMNEHYGSYEDMMKCWPLPIMVILFTILEIVAFIVDKNTSGLLNQYLRYDPKKRNEFWRFITYMFTHSNIWHLGSNVIFQLFLGIPIEIIHKWRVTVVYLSGVLLGCMGASIFNPTNSLVGASGGVFALVTAHIAIVILNWSQMRLALVNLFICLVYCITNLVSALVKPEKDVSNICHLFGGFAGLLVGIGILRNLKEEAWEKKLWWIAVGVYFAMMIAGIIYHVKFY